MFGPVSVGSIVGKAWFSYWPVDDVGFVPHESYTDTDTEPAAASASPLAIGVRGVVLQSQTASTPTPLARHWPGLESRVVNFIWVQQPGEMNRPGDVHPSPAQFLRPEGYA